MRVPAVRRCCNCLLAASGRWLSLASGRQSGRQSGRHHAARERWGGVPCSVHVPRAGSAQALRTRSAGPPPLLHSTRHTAPALLAPLWCSTAIEDSRVAEGKRWCGAVLWVLTAAEDNRVSRPRMPGVRTGEVKEEGRMHGARSAWAVSRPGGHEQGRTPGIRGSQRCMHAEQRCPTTATGRKQPTHTAGHLLQSSTPDNAQGRR
jgi:hypothetical protein